MNNGEQEVLQQGVQEIDGHRMFQWRGWGRGWDGLWEEEEEMSTASAAELGPYPT